MTAEPLNLSDKLAEATSLYSQWRLVEADIILRKLRDEPGPHQIAALNLHSDILWSLNDLQGAALTNDQILELDPLHVKARQRAVWMGGAAPAIPYSVEWADERVSAGGKPQVVYPATVRLLNNEGQHRIALKVAGRALSVLRTKKADRRIINKLRLEVAIAREGLHDLRGALDALEQIAPDLPVALSAAVSKARILHELGYFREAEESLPPPAPNAPAFNNVAYHIYLSTGRIQDAFELYKSRKETAAFYKLLPNYRQVDINEPGLGTKKALLVAEGGPGDELRMSSLYGDLIRVFGPLSISCDPRLESLLQRTYPEIDFLPSPRSRDERRKADYSERNRVNDALGAKILTNHLIDEAERADVALSVFDCLSQLRPTREDFKSTERRHLSPNPDLVTEVAKWFTPGFNNIGIAWRSVITNSTRNKHYFEVTELAALSILPNTEFWILQPGATDEEIEILSKYVRIRTVPEIDMLDDFEGQAALISRLDAVVSPCTTTAELSGAMGVTTFILANTNMTVWRKNPDGSDVWHTSGRLISGDSVGHRKSVINNLVQSISEGEVTVMPSGAGTTNKEPIVKFSPLRFVKRFVRAGMARFGGSTRTTGSSLTSQHLTAASKELLRQKSVKYEHIQSAQAAIAKDKTGTMAALKAGLQFRAGNFSDALESAKRLAPPSNIDQTALISLRNDMADLGRYDYAIAGLHALLNRNPNPDASTRIGNAEFEKQAYEYLALAPQPKKPKGYVVIFGLNNRVTLGLMTPLAWQLARTGYYVCSANAAAMPPSQLPELKGISGSIRWSGMSLTDEPFKTQALRNNWTIDLANRLVECSGINYFTFFAERLAKLSNKYEVDVADPKVFADFESLLQRSDVALTVCNRLLSLAELGLPVRLAAMDTHFAPAGIVRQWCQEVGVHKGIELVALSISYENYFSNLSSIEATTISIENLTANPGLRHPLFGGRSRFDKYLAAHPETALDVNSTTNLIKINRSKVDDKDTAERNQVVQRIDDARKNGRKIFAAFGKVLIDFAAPYDRGHTFADFKEWIQFLVNEISKTENLLIIKPHPHEKRTEIASSDVQTLRALLPPTLPDNVIFLDHSTFNSFELAELVDLTLLWNGTAYTELPVLGKPVIAESIWAERDYPIDGTQLKSRDAYREVLRLGRIIEPNEASKRRATAFIQFMKSPEVAITFGYTRRAGTNQSIGASEFINSDMQKLMTSQDDLSLALAASRFFENS